MTKTTPNTQKTKHTLPERIFEIDRRIGVLEVKRDELIRSLRAERIKKIVEESAAVMTPEEVATKLGIQL